MYVESQWLGHSSSVADSHYDAVIDKDFDAITNPPMASPGQDDDQRQDDAEAA